MRGDLDLHKRLTYPVYLIESKKTKLNIADIVYRKTGFITFSRVPAKGKFVKGLLFDSSGLIYEYEGECGWPRYGGWIREIAEILIVPSLFSKVLEAAFYFGPRLRTSKHLSVEEFRTNVLEATARYGKKDLPQLRRLLDSKSDYRSIIEAVDWWRYFGGKRDEDGHPI